MQTRMIASLLMAVLVGSSCAKQNLAGSSEPAPASAAVATPKRSANLITSDELAETSAQNLYQAVQVLRPNWFRSRSSTTMGGTNRTGGANDVLVVYIDNTRYGDANALQQLTMGGVNELRYYDPSEATNRFGTGHTQGAIVIRMIRKP